ncbi:MAG TPA: lytic transglycosylase domain-containing protein, partial [Acetobacteraceae bacterium]|nr:lytic transglycosylase domain-containing protein [Acetobacteraceae bacterium]
IAAAQAAAGLPSGLLAALGRVESGRLDPQTGTVRPWPWTINVAGQGFFFPNKATAVAAVQELQADGIRSIDVGCLQVNLMYHPAAFASLEQAFDPAANARYAARFLNALYYRSRDWTQAIGEYHSETPTLGAAYRTRVMARWHPPGGAGPPGYADFAPVTTTYGAFRSDAAYADFAPAGLPRPRAHRPSRR